MRRMKILVAVVTTAVASSALAGSAWGGTILTSPAGTQVEAEAEIRATAEGVTALHGSINIACGKSALEGKVTNEGGSTEAVEATTSNFTLEECGTNTVTVLSKGTLKWDGTGSGNGTLTSTGAEITVQTHGAVGTIHCIYRTESTSLGTFTGSETTGSTGTLDANGATIPLKSTDAGCGSKGEMTGSYKFTAPDYLDVDALSEPPSEEPGTTLTSPAGTTVPAGTKLKASAESSIVFDLPNPFNVTCKKSTLEGEITNEGGSEEQAGGPITNLTFEECGKDTVTVLAKGKLQVTTDSGSNDGNGEITATGTKITLLLHNSTLGTVHCIFKTDHTRLGTLTGSKNREGGTATWALNGAPLSYGLTDFGCGAEPLLTGSYTFSSPDYLTVDTASEPPPEGGTTLTSPAGTTLAKGVSLEAAAQGSIIFDREQSITCKKSTLKGELSNAGGAGQTVTGSLNSLSVTECGLSTLTVLKPGSLEIHTDNETSDGNGTVTSTGLELTLLTHNIVGTVHCLYRTESTNAGTFTGSKNSGATAVWSPVISLPPISTDFLCGGGETLMTGSYAFTNPDYLDVD